MAVKVKCIKDVTISSVNIAYLEGNEYEMPAKQANDYSEYFEKMETAPKNKAKKTTENK